MKLFRKTAPIKEQRIILLWIVTNNILKKLLKGLFQKRFQFFKKRIIGFFLKKITRYKSYCTKRCISL